jgi:hypothetical protein
VRLRMGLATSGLYYSYCAPCSFSKIGVASFLRNSLCRLTK